MPTREQLRAGEWEVVPVPLTLAQELVTQYHYAKGGSNTAVAVHGLFRKGTSLDYSQCVGVCWWLPPTRAAAKSVYSEHPENVLALSRMCLTPDSPYNAGSFMLARSIRMLDERWSHLVTYADTYRGHVGTVYKASNWQPSGMTKERWVYVRKADGRVMSPKRGPRTLSHTEMLESGFEAVGRFAKFIYRIERDGREPIYA